MTLDKYMNNRAVVNVYGNIPDKSELLIAVGNYNNIHGLLTYFPHEHYPQFRSFPDVITPSVIEVILTYENPQNITDSSKVYFTLAIKDNTLINNIDPTQPILSIDPPNSYINVEVDNELSARAIISSEKRYFWIDYSIIDKIPRSQLLSGSLYSLKTTVDNHDYIVSWKIKEFSDGDLIIFLPTTWYESESNGICEKYTGSISIVEKLQLLNFRGYSTKSWCEHLSDMTHCSIEEHCGECLGQCSDPNTICHPNINSSPTFICGSPLQEPNLNNCSNVTFAPIPQSTGTNATWLAVISILIIVILLTWGLSRKS